MKYFKDITLRIAFVLALSFLFGASLGAYEISTPFTPATSSTSSARRVEAKHKIEEFKLRRSNDASSTVDRACSILISRIGARLKNFDALYEHHAAAYVLRREKLSHIEVKLSERGISTKQLHEDISLLDVKIAAFADAKEKVRAALEDVRGGSCTDEEDGFRASVQSLREAQKSVAQAAKDIHDFVSGTLKEDITSLRQAI